jgi:hypothetical protein
VGASFSSQVATFALLYWLIDDHQVVSGLFADAGEATA